MLDRKAKNDVQNEDYGPFVSLPRLEAAGDVAWSPLLAALGIYASVFISPTLRFVTLVLAIVWVLDRFRAALFSPTLRLEGTPLATYGAIQQSRASSGSVPAITLAVASWRAGSLAFRPLLWVVPVVALVLTYWLLPGPPLKFDGAASPFCTFQAQATRKPRRFGYVFSLAVHGLPFLSMLFAFLASFITPPPPPQKVWDVTPISWKPPAPAPKKKLQPPAISRNGIRLETKKEQADTVAAKKDGMTIEFEADRKQLLPKILIDYGARVAFVDKVTADDYFAEKRSTLPPVAVYSPVSWDKTEVTNLAGEYLLRLTAPSELPQVRNIYGRLGGSQPVMIFLVFPGGSDGFEARLQAAIKNAAGPGVMEPASQVSRVLVSFIREQPGFAVSRVEKK